MGDSRHEGVQIDERRIDGLVDPSKRLQALERQQGLLRVEIGAIANAESIRLMEEASQQLQSQALSQVVGERGEGKETLGHTYIDTVIKDRAKVSNGNIGIRSQNSG